MVHTISYTVIADTSACLLEAELGNWRYGQRVYKAGEIEMTKAANRSR